VWNVGVNPGVEQMVKNVFPGVDYIEEDKNVKKSFREKVLEIFCQLKGDYVLLLDEDVLLPQESVKLFYERMREARGAALLTPEVIDEEGKSQVRLASTNVASGCLFMRRKVLNEENWDEKLMSKRLADMKKEDFFYWETGEEEIKVVFLEEYKVRKA
jgi:hypothetical protein